MTILWLFFLGFTIQISKNVFNVKIHNCFMRRISPLMPRHNSSLETNISMYQVDKNINEPVKVHSSISCIFILVFFLPYGLQCHPETWWYVWVCESWEYQLGDHFWIKLLILNFKRWTIRLLSFSFSLILKIFGNNFTLIVWSFQCCPSSYHPLNRCIVLN